MSEANRAAFEAIDRWPEWPSSVLLVVGPEASGKSHLARIFSADHHADAYNAGSIDWHGVASALASSEPQKPILVEDAGPGINEAGLFHLINAVMSAGGWLLLTARTLPTEWQLALADLISRLRAATPVVIGPPDDRLLENIIAKHFADRQTVVDPAVIRYSVPRMERSYLAALQLVERLDEAALARKSGITRALAADVLNAGDDEPLLPGFEEGFQAFSTHDDNDIETNEKPS